ncbi:Hypothetical protein NocV09_01201450 [Nannochloropsis oceanica]
MDLSVAAPLPDSGTTISSTVVKQSSTRRAVLGDKENTSTTHKLETSATNTLLSTSIAGGTALSLKPGFLSKRRALVRSSSTPPASSSASHKGSLGHSFKAAAATAALSVVSFGGKHNTNRQRVCRPIQDGNGEFDVGPSSHENEDVSPTASAAATLPRPAFYPGLKPTREANSAATASSVKMTGGGSGGGGMGLGSALFGGFGLLGNSAPAGGPSMDDSNFIARLGSLAGMRLELQDSSPERHTHGDGVNEMVPASPFNEGYGTRRRLPHDFSLKSSLCFESAQPFNWCRPIPGSAEAKGMLRHLRESIDPPSPPSPQPQEDDGSAVPCARPPASFDEALEIWVAASLSYAHPAEPLAASMHLPLQMVRKTMENAFARDPAPVVGVDEGANGGGGGGNNKQTRQPDPALMLYKRLRQWEEAFRHLYTLYRHDPSLTFYSQAPDFTVVWTREEDGGGGRDEVGDGMEYDGVKEERGKGGTKEVSQLKVVISHSRRWLRARLREADIPFSVPLAPDAEARDNEEATLPHITVMAGGGNSDRIPRGKVGAEEELQELLSSVTGQMAGGMGMVEMQSRRRPKHLNDLPRQRSQLVLKGHEAVHGLFNFLLNLENGLGPSSVADVPRLLADRPFMHGSMQRLQVAFNGQVQRTLLQGSGGDARGKRGRYFADEGEEDEGEEKGMGGMETVYQLKLCGPVLPGQLRRLAGVVHFLQQDRKGKEVGVGKNRWKKQKTSGSGGDWSLVMEPLNGTEAFNLQEGGREGEVGGGGRGGELGRTRMRSLKEVRWSAEKEMFAVITTC